MTIELTSPTQVLRFLESQGIHLKRSLGQNFLVDANYVQRILTAADLDPSDTVIEIGPGVGVLTLQLAQRVKKVICIEVDGEMIQALRAVLAGVDNVTLVHRDVLQVDWPELLAQQGIDRFKVVANLPYYITTPVLTMLLEQGLPVTELVVMVQREVAQRMVASPGTKDYGAFSVFTQFYSSPRIVTIVPPTVFLPPPKVHSAVVALDVAGHRLPFAVGDPKTFFQIVRAAFGQRRKMLRRALRGLPWRELTPEVITQWLEAANIEPTRRGETLSLEEFALLNRLLPRYLKTTTSKDSEADDNDSHSLHQSRHRKSDFGPDDGEHPELH